LREGLFIKKNKDRWEEIQDGTTTDPDEMAKNFTQLVDDLAYAKTFYPTSRVTQYINAMASRIFLGIYQNRKEESNRLVKFWKYDVPDTMYRHRLTVLFTLCFFLLFFVVGFFSARQDPPFIREVLGDGYVDLTERNIEEGNPFGIYGDENSLYMFVRIMLNNIRVSFTYFFQGLLLGIPTMMNLGKEAIRLGAFEQMFFAKGLGLQAVVTVLIHGLLELTAIIIACAGGLIMGKSALFPGTISRIDAFRNGTKDGVKLIVALIPIFVIAALLESYVTRYYKMPLAYSISILAVCSLFVLWYFVLYPYKLYNPKKKEVQSVHA
jgi:uncharacterized membrane protein SpoIIM required for sporulation